MPLGHFSRKKHSKNVQLKSVTDANLKGVEKIEWKIVSEKFFDRRIFPSISITNWAIIVEIYFPFLPFLCAALPTCSNLHQMKNFSHENVPFTFYVHPFLSFILDILKILKNDAFYFILTTLTPISQSPMCFCHSRKLLLFISQLICCRLSYAEIAVVVVETVNEIKNTHMYISCCHITNYIKNVFLSASSFFVVSRENFTRHFSPYLVTFVVSTLFQFFFVSLFFVCWILGMVKILNFF